jgi:MYXO-CTERM domain-containing protein
VAAVLTVAGLTLSAAPVRAQARMPTHVACVGDSITYGYLASSSSKSYPSDLQAMFGSSVQVKNFGHNSATMLSVGDTPYINQSEYTAATSFVSGAGASAVVDVIIMLGTNDSKSYNWAPTAGSTRAAQFMTDCAAMVDHFTSLSTHPVVYLALPPAIYSNSFGIDETVTSTQIDPIIQQVAMQKGMPLIDIHTPSVGHQSYFQDGVHPTDAGYMLVAQWMHDGLLRVPTVSITMPAANASIAGTSVGITADASGGTVPITSVQFLRGSTSIATVTQTPFMTTWTNVAPGPYTLTAKATDKTGAAATSAAVSITVTAGGAGGAGGAAGRGGSGGGGATGGSAGAAGGGGAGGTGVGTGGNGLAGHGGSTGGAQGSGGSSTGATGGGNGSGGATGTGGGISTGGATGSGGEGTSTGGAGTSTGGAGTSTGGTGTSTGGAGASGSGGTSMNAGGGGGCSCSQAGTSSPAFAAFGLVLLAMARRRRR